MPEVQPGLGTFVAPRGSEQVLIDRGRKLNARSIPPILPQVEKLSKETQVYIFNVGPWPHAGSFGRKRIPAVPGGGLVRVVVDNAGNPTMKKSLYPGNDQYSDALVIPGIDSELYPESETSMKRVDSDGYETALQIIGVGAFHSPSNALTRYGVAVCRQWPPTKEEIAAAWKALVEGELEVLVAEANSASARGPQAVEQTINERHYQAARLLKKSAADCPWMNRSVETRERVECKFCGEPMKTGIPRCPNCKEIVDQALYDSLTAKK